MTTTNPQASHADGGQAAPLKRYERLCVVVLDMPIWSGMRVLTEADMSALGAADTSKDVIAPGSKKVYDPEKLKPFAALKQRARRLLESHGVAFAKGIAIPLEGSKAVLAALDAIQDDYRKAVEALLATYAADVEDWIRRNPQYAEIIRAGRLSESEVAARFHASYMTLRIQALRPEDEARLEAGADALGGKLLDEASVQCEKIVVSLLGKTECDGRCLPTLRTLCRKLKGLSFLSGGIAPITGLLDRILQRTPAKGAFGGEVFAELQTAVSILANKRLMTQFAQGRITFEEEHRARQAGIPLAAPGEKGSLSGNLFAEASLLAGSIASSALSVSSPSSGSPESSVASDSAASSGPAEGAASDAVASLGSREASGEEDGKDEKNAEGGRNDERKPEAAPVIEGFMPSSAGGSTASLATFASAPTPVQGSWF